MSVSMMLRNAKVGTQASSRPARRALAVVPRAQAQAGVAQKKPEPQKPKDALLSFAASINLPTDEGVFGFKPFSEVWCGRLAMMGFVTSITEEFFTGQGTLAQIRLMDDGAPSFTALALLLAFFGGAMLYGTADTLNKLRAKKMSAKEMARYKHFLALSSDKDAKMAALAMKSKGDFTTPGNDYAAIAATKAAGSPVDGFLSTNEVSEAAAASSAIKASEAKADAGQVDEVEVAQRRAAAQAALAAEALFSGNSEMKYALDVELTNGRYAMLGFLAAVLVEAATGNGIIGQLIQYAKLTGLLGADSGF